MQAFADRHEHVPLPDYDHPPQLETDNGTERRVGVEIEFGGIDTRTAATRIRSALGGGITQQSAHSFTVERTAIGDVKVELDLRYAHPAKNDEPDTSKWGREILGDFAGAVVPQEVITEPIEISRLEQTDRLVDCLAAAGAEGTADSPLYAFGLHLNPEAASLEASSLLRLIRAFNAANDWLREEINPDWGRRALRWARPHHTSWRERIMDPSYRPDMTGLIADYVRENPSRNHDLDLLPLFRHIDEDLVSHLSGEAHGASRPAFHYRLPDSRIGVEGWSVARDWNLWVAIERLADDEARLGEICKAWRRRSRGEISKAQWKASYMRIMMS